MIIASFDIGKVNFGQYVEEFDLDSLISLSQEYDSLPKELQKKVMNNSNDKIDKILEKVYENGKRLNIGIYDLRTDKNSKTLDIDTRKNFVIHLNKYKYLWDKCDVFLIEQQFFKNVKRPFGKGRTNNTAEANVDAIKLSECLAFWFLDKYPDKEVIFFPSHFKTKILGAPLDMTKPQRKNWAIKKMEYIFRNNRDDEDMVKLFDLKDRIFKKRITTEKHVEKFLATFDPISEDIYDFGPKLVNIKKRQKLDDAADPVVQLQAYKFRKFVGRF